MKATASLFLSLALATGGHSSPLPAGFDLAWDLCGPAGARNEDFACDTNDNEYVLVASFVSPIRLDELHLCEARVELYAEDFVTPLSPWWNVMASGSCRPSGLGVSIDAGEDSLVCRDYWRTLASHSEVFTLDWPYLGSLGVMIFMPEGQRGVVESGVEYFAFRIHLRTDHTVGVGSCEGCRQKMYIGLKGMTLSQGVGQPYAGLDQPLRDPFISWQGGVVPAHPTSWGRIKSLYR